MLSQKLPHLWFTENKRYLFYFLRELTGVFIALFIILFPLLYLFISFVGEYSYPKIIEALLPLAEILYETLFKIAFFSALFHTFTWLWVSVKLSPFSDKKSVKIIEYIMLLIIWLLISYLMFHLFYVRIS